MKNKDFCDYIQTQDSFKEILLKYKPQLVFLSGSRGVGTELPTSDYDLVAITNKRRIKTLIGYEDIIVKNDRGLKSHCYIYSLDYVESWLNQDSTFPKSIVSDLWFQNSISLKNEDNIIINTNNSNIEFWYENQDKIAYRCLYNLFLKHGPYQNTNAKFLGHCILCFALIKKSDQQHEYIKKIKQQYRDRNIDLSVIFKLWKELEQQWNDFLIQQK